MFRMVTINNWQFALWIIVYVPVELFCGYFDRHFKYVPSCFLVCRNRYVYLSYGFICEYFSRFIRVFAVWFAVFIVVRGLIKRLVVWFEVYIVCGVINILVVWLAVFHCCLQFNKTVCGLIRGLDCFLPFNKRASGCILLFRAE